MPITQGGKARLAHELDTPAPHAPPSEKKPRLEVQLRDATDEKVTKHPGVKRNRKKPKHQLPEPYSPDDVLWRDVVQLLGSEVVDAALEDGMEWDAPFGFKEEVQLEVVSLSAAGTSLSLAPEPCKPWVIVTPFALPGETIRARVYRHSRLHSYADLIDIRRPNTILRDMNRVQCKYFGECAGCQYQMLSYETQLDLKRNVLLKAYQNFSELPPSSIPTVGPTIPSPLQYNYRTKITPHFEAPRRKKAEAHSDDNKKPDWLKIGFNRIGTRHVMDIEECPIATPILNETLSSMRQDIIKNIHTYKKGVSLLLRDSLEVQDSPSNIDSLCTTLEKHVCVTDHKAIVRERVGDMLFEYPGGSFFQNNNSVLAPLTSYVRDAIFPPLSAGIEADSRPTHLVDAYCGSGLFAITLSPHFEVIAGIELSVDSIKAATSNATLSRIPESKCSFRSGDASAIFATVSHFPPEKTALVVDPPRKGCDGPFLDQLLEFRCARVVYVSCNVHTQARDIGIILRKTEGQDKKSGGRGRYLLQSLRGVDLFPQTAHVESIAVLRLI